MKVIVGMATFAGRQESLKESISSLKDQVDEIYLYDNSVETDKKDNGKFHGLNLISEPCYYLTCDDDIIYPKDYVENMVKNIDTYKCIVTHHGKNISENNYLSDSERYHFSVRNFHIKELDVAGTAVTGFRTDYFNPRHLTDSKDFFVSDLLFAIQAKKENKKILLVEHPTNWIKQNMNIDFQKSISYIEEKDQSRQDKFKNELLKWRI